MDGMDFSLVHIEVTVLLFFYPLLYNKLSEKKCGNKYLIIQYGFIK